MSRAGCVAILHAAPAARLAAPTVEDNITLQELDGPASEAFLTEHGERLDDDERRILAGIAPLIAEGANGRAGRSALVHADYRADNMLVDPAGNRPCPACDWQTLAVGLPGRDLGGSSARA